MLEKAARPEGTLSLVGKTALKDLPYVLRASDLYVGNNESGPQHLAAALGVLGPWACIPAAVQATEWGLLGPNAAALRRNVYCGPCYIPSASLEKIGSPFRVRPAEVYRLCTRLLGVA